MKIHITTCTYLQRSPTDDRFCYEYTCEEVNQNYTPTPTLWSDFSSPALFVSKFHDVVDINVEADISKELCLAIQEHLNVNYTKARPSESDVDGIYSAVRGKILRDMSRKTIEHAAHVLTQMQDTKTTFFSRLPKALIFKIAGYTGNPEVHDPDTSAQIARVSCKS